MVMSKLFPFTSVERNQVAFYSLYWSLTGCLCLGFLLPSLPPLRGCSTNDKGRFRVYMNILAIGLGVELRYWYRFLNCKSAGGSPHTSVGPPPLSPPDDENPSLSFNDVTPRDDSPTSCDSSPRLAVFSGSRECDRVADRLIMDIIGKF